MGKNYNNYYKKRNTDGPVKEPEEKKEETTEEATEAVEEKEPVIETKEEAAPPTKEPEKAIVNVDRLNFRAKPSEDGEIFSILNKGKEVDLISETTDAAGWSYISVDGKLGYVMTEFIDIKR